MKNLLILILLAALGWCFWNHRREARTVSRQLDDASITAEVLGKIAGSDPTALLNVRISTVDGKVSLDGVVKSASEKEILARTAKRISGVREIRNNLTVNGGLARRTPAEIERDVEIMASIKKRLIEEEGLRGLDIHVDVYDGRVVLTGSVPSVDQADLAEKIAAGNPGVKQVYNHILINKEEK